MQTHDNPRDGEARGWEGLTPLPPPLRPQNPSKKIHKLIIVQLYIQTPYKLAPLSFAGKSSSSRSSKYPRPSLYSSSLHDYLEFSQPSSCLNEAM